MPKPGIIDAAVIAACRAKIDSEFGPIPPGLQGDVDGYREKLARCIAFAAQYVRDNAIVNAGQTVAAGTFIDSVTSAAITGEGVVDTTGDLS